MDLTQSGRIEWRLFFFKLQKKVSNEIFWKAVFSRLYFQLHKWRSISNSILALDILIGFWIDSFTRESKALEKSIASGYHKMRKYLCWLANLIYLEHLSVRDVWFRKLLVCPFISMTLIYDDPIKDASYSMPVWRSPSPRHVASDLSTSSVTETQGGDHGFSKLSVDDVCNYDHTVFTRDPFHLSLFQMHYRPITNCKQDYNHVLFFKYFFIFSTFLWEMFLILHFFFLFLYSMCCVEIRKRNKKCWKKWLVIVIMGKARWKDHK